jgi:hypothetical protein
MFRFVSCRVSNPDSFDTDPDPAFKAEYRSESRVFIKKIEKKFTAEKTTIYISLGLHKGRSSCKRSLQLSKENIQHFKT